MFKIDDAFLADLGLTTLPQAEKEAMKHHIYETLEMRVGMKLAQQMSNEQLDEFEAYINRNDEAGALKWLESNFPDYKKVVSDELENLRQEVKATAPQIIAASAQGAAPQPESPPQPQQPLPPTPQYPPQ